MGIILIIIIVLIIIWFEGSERCDKCGGSLEYRGYPRFLHCTRCNNSKEV